MDIREEDDFWEYEKLRWIVKTINEKVGVKVSQSEA